MTEESFTLNITGMTCGACVASVEKVVSKVDSVAEVAVNLPLNAPLFAYSRPPNSIKRKPRSSQRLSGVVLGQRNPGESLLSLVKQNQNYEDKDKRYRSHYS